MKSLWLILIVSLLPLSGSGQSSIGAYPAKPVNGIYDPANWLEPTARDELTERIAGAREKGDSAIYVVILTEKPGGDPDYFARGLGGDWAGEGLWGMVFHLPGDPSYPKFFGELKATHGWTEHQKSQFQDSINDALAEVIKKAAAHEDERLQVIVGARDLTVNFGYLGLVAARIEKNKTRPRGDRLSPKKVETKGGLSLWSILAVIVPLLLITAAALGYLMAKKEEEEGDNYTFPETSPRKRFLAPWSGGGNVMVEFGPDREARDSRRGGF